MKEKILTLYCCILYPMYTVWFSSQASLLYENLSYVGNVLGKRMEFFLWGIATASALAIGIWRCLPYCVNQRVMKNFVYGTTCFLLVSILLPYLPDTYPFVAFIHIALAFVAPLSLLSCVALVLFELFLGQAIVFQTSLNLFLLICIISLGILFRFGSVNSLVEIFVAISCTFLIMWIARELKKV